ncbi:VWA domain-containing protein [Nocardiopsis potens]|uniref:VWA domain-containing protein n=1 Tax=Nocardiopsis potens TaxID=1246458 RepID=UPI000347A5A9|nr:VWA domain-containing protein [Nocardiopsis potens]
MRPGRRRARAAALAALLAAALAPACTPQASGVLRVLAGSELADMEPLLERAEQETGVRVEMDYTGTLEGVQQVVSGQAARDYDAIWFSSNRYLALHPEGRDALGEQTSVMASPVVLGVARSTAEELGWTGGAEVTWADVAEAAAGGDLSYGMTSPAASNSGFSALVGVAAALSDAGSALRASDVAGAAPELERFFSGQRLTAGSSGWLADAYVRRATGQDPGPELNAMVNYESVLLSVERREELPEPLAVVHPADGAVTADYPLTLLEPAGAQAAERYGALVDHLMGEEVQEEIGRTTHRRPMAPGAADPGPPSLPELPFPATAEVADGLIGAYFDEYRRPARTVFVLDSSGSMAGERMAALRTAVDTLTGGDGGSLDGRFQRFYHRERVTLLPFASGVHRARTFEVDSGDPGEALDGIRAGVRALEPGGWTAGYAALAEAYGLLAEEETGGRFTSIVLLTDGEVNRGPGLAEFRDGVHAGLGGELRGVPVFPVLLGESDPAEMEELAELTGGRVFDARSTSLDEAFREIRGYQ